MAILLSQSTDGTDWAIDTIEGLAKLYAEYGPGELLVLWKEALEKAVRILESKALRPDCVKTGKELPRLPVVEPHSVLELVVV